MKETGRRVAGPAADLVQLDSPKGLKHTALAFRAPFDHAPGLGDELVATIPFMEEPGVSGLVSLAHYDRENAVFVYPTGTVWTIAEVVRAFADLGESCGHRAGLELAYVTSQILMEATDKGSPHGVWSHGSLTPWRLALRGDGQVRILGYGLPQVELAEHLLHEASPIKEDSFRYAPPERIEGREEDITSDLFALTLIAVELMVGKPVYDGLLADVRQQAARAEGTYRLYKWRDLLPATIRDALAPAIKYDDDARYRDPAEYVYAMHDLLGSPDIEGPSLMEIVQRVKMAERKGKPIVSGRTAALTREELAAMAAEIDDPEEMPLPPPSVPRPNAPEPEPEPDVEVPRWSGVSRSRRSRNEPEAPPAAVPAAPTRRTRRSDPQPEPDRAESLRARLRRSRSEGPPSRRSSGGEDPRQALRRRLKERPSASGAPAPVQTPAPEPPKPNVETTPLSTSSGGAEALLARLRSSSGRRRGGALRTPAPSAAPALPTPPVLQEEPGIALDLVQGGEQRRVTVGKDEAVAVAALRHAALEYDLLGRVVSAPRLSQEGKWWRGHEPAHVIDPGKPVVVERVTNTTVQLEIRTDGSPGHRFTAPVGVAVPSESLVRHLVQWLGLSGEGWRLQLGDATLLPEQILADLEPVDGQILQLRR